MERKYGVRKLKKSVENYFADCDEANSRSKKGIAKPYTMSGMLFHIGLSKKELKKLCEDEKCRAVIDDAERKIEAFTEEKALSGELSNNASQCSLKYHFGWGEKDEKAESSHLGLITVTLSDEAKELAR